MPADKELDEELIAKVKKIQVRASHLADDVFSGEYESAFKGRGLEFEEVREYLPGDDVRAIDWNVTARCDKPYIKTFRDERELTVLFAVDVSASSRFGTQSKYKSEVAAEIAALLAYTALRNNDKVGLIIFSNHIEHYIPPKKGRGHIWRLIREILAYESESRETSLKVSLDFISRCVKRRSIVFLISDFLDEDYHSEIQALGRRHELIGIGVNDQREIELPNIGYIELEDLETGEGVLVNTSNRLLREEFKKTAKTRLREQKKFFQRSGIDYISVEANESYIDPIIEYFRMRDKRLRR